MRIAVALALALIAMPALAASPKVEAAIKTLRAVAADSNQLRTFCALMELQKVAEGDKKDDQKLQAAIDGYVKRLGTEFQSDGKSWRASMRILPMVKRLTQCSTNLMTDAVSCEMRGSAILNGMTSTIPGKRPAGCLPKAEPRAARLENHPLR